MPKILQDLHHETLKSICNEEEHVVLECLLSTSADTLNINFDKSFVEEFVDFSKNNQDWALIFTRTILYLRQEIINTYLHNCELENTMKELKEDCAKLSNDLEMLSKTWQEL